MTGNCIEKCFLVLNVKFQVKLRFITFYCLCGLKGEETLK